MNEMNNQEKNSSSQLPQGMQQLIQKLRTMGLPLALSLAICIALLLTGISIGAYFNSSFSSIDLSKPKYADIRTQLLPKDEENKKTDEDNGPITKQSIRKNIDELVKIRQDLQKLSNFDNEALEDAQLGIGNSPAVDPVTPQ